MNSRPRTAFTLVETIAVMVILGVLSTVVSTVLYASTDAYSIAAKSRESSDRLSQAMERITHCVREHTSNGHLIVSRIREASQDALEFESGLRIDLSQSTVWLTDEDHPRTALLSSANNLRFIYVLSSNPFESRDSLSEEEFGDLAVIEILLEHNGRSLRTRIFLRSSIGDDG